LIAQVLTGLLEGVGRSDQALEWALKVLRKIAPMLRIDLQAIQNGWKILGDAAPFVFSDLRRLLGWVSRQPA
jgi:hypothetical protein